MRTLRFVALGLALVYGLACAWMAWSQERLLFPATRLKPEYRFTLPMPHEEWTIPSDGVALHALRIRTIQSQAKGVAIYFHGNGGSIADWLAAAPPFLDMGYDVGLLLKYPFATEAIAKDVTCPTFLIHGDRDDLVPFNHGQQLVQMFGGPTRLYAIPGGGHNSFWGQQAYFDALADIAETVR